MIESSRTNLTRRANPLLIAALLLPLAPALAQIVPQPVEGDATIRIDLGKPSPQSIPRTLFGTFLEPIGNSTYNGLWAEILENPSFEAGLWDVRHIETMVRAEPELARSSALGLPLPWLPLDGHQGNRYEFRYGDAANSARSLEIMGVPGEPTGIVQRIYLPAERELTYKGSLYARHLSGGATQLTVSLVSRTGPHATLATATLDAAAATWTKLPFTLKLENGALASLDQAELRIAVQGDERVLLDQVSLMPADALNGLDPEMVKAAAAMHTPLIRYGGNFTSGYHWRDGIGPSDKRVSMPNVAWGIPEYNTFGTDEFLHFCQLIHAEPQIALNLGSGTPDEAADWVRYVDDHWADPEANRKGGGLLWELGNELWGSWNTGWPTLDELAPRTLAFSQAIRAVDPSARLIATGQDPDHFEQWNAKQLANPVGTENYLSTHFVETTTSVQLQNASPEFITAATLALPIGLEHQLKAMHDQIAASPQKDTVKTAFTEWLWGGGGGTGGGRGDHPNYDNVAGALTTAGLLNALMRSSDIVPISDMTGILEFAGIWKKRGVVYRTPAAYAFGMIAGAPAEHLLPVEVKSGTYTVHNGSTRIPEIEAVPYLDVDAAISQDGRTVTLFVVNRSQDRDLTAQLAIPGLRKATAQAQTLSAPSLYAANDEMDPEAIVPETKPVPVGPAFHYTFPRASFTVLTLPR
jgi:alpha-N-arabinofuranosidase